jgi:hypothetical protein
LKKGINQLAQEQAEKACEREHGFIPDRFDMKATEGMVRINWWTSGWREGYICAMQQLKFAISQKKQKKDYSPYTEDADVAALIREAIELDGTSVNTP